MFITERQNYNESALFLLAARSTLSEVVNASKSQNKKDLVEFIHNEASDFEIMGLLVGGSLPPVKYDAVAEAILFSHLKEQVLRNFSKLTENVSEKTLNTFIHEVDSVYPRFSTQKPVLEFYSSLQEQGFKIPSGGNLEKIAGAAGEAGEKVGSFFKGAQDKYHHYLDQRAASQGDLVAKGKVLWHQAKEAGGDSVSAVSTWLNKVLAMAKANPEMAYGIGGTALAALVVFGAYQAYKRFFSKAAQACSGKKGAEKSACMTAYRTKAKQAQAKVLKMGMAACSKSKDPEKCKSAIRAKASKVQ
jgi:hypothetical protein